jgi:hypothetical protein
MSTQVCRYCDEPIEVESGLLVQSRSGDAGGTYDYCTYSPDELHHPTPTPRKARS